MPNPAVVRVAASQLGYVEGPASNQTKYWQELDPALQGQPWCAALVSWVYRHAGCPLPAIDRPYGFVYCPDMIAWARAHGHIVTSPEAGDIVIYGGGVHTGIYESATGPGGFTAIEGNTSAGVAGSQVNGGGVYRRARTVGWVTCFVRPVAAPTTVPVPVAAPTEPVRTSPVVLFQRSLKGKPVAGIIVPIQTDANGDGSVPAPPGYLMVAAAGAHDKYDPNTHDPDSLVVPVGARQSGDGMRLVVAGGPKSTTVGAPVLVED